MKKTPEDRQESRRAREAKYREEVSRRFDAQARHMENQKRSIDRLLLMNMEATAALMEIANMDPQGDEWDDAAAFAACVERAQAAIATMERIRSSDPGSGNGENPEESEGNGVAKDPTDSEEVNTSGN
jgi:hypothetical protein